MHFRFVKTVILVSILFMLTPAAVDARPECSCYTYERELELNSPPLSGIDVSDLQLRLAQLGYYIGPINGVYNTHTSKAVINFQKAKGLKSLGLVGPDTWEALVGEIRTIRDIINPVEIPEGKKEFKIIIDTNNLLLTIFLNGKVLREYPVAIGKYTSPSPVGEWKIINKGYESGGSFGTRWMGLNVPWGNYGIHGTNRPWSVGWPASAGCFRMYNEDIEAIYNLIPVGTPVIVKGEFIMPTGPLKPGTGQPENVILQTRLRDKGFYLFGPADGSYGLMTKLAVKQFQLHHGLPSTGTADTATLRFLELYLPDS